MSSKAPKKIKRSRASQAKTRHLLLDFLRAGPASAGDLAARSGLTINAVRFHIAGLEAKELVAIVGTRRGAGAGKPAVLYAATPEADAALSNAYAPTLSAVLQELRDEIPASQVGPFLNRVGERLAARAPRVKGSLLRRAHAGAKVLRSLGGLAEVSRTRHGYKIVGKGCPLGAAVSAEPCVCSAVESLLAVVTDARVTSRCEHSARPSCRFEVSAA